MTDDVSLLAARAEDVAIDADELSAVLDELLARSPGVGTAIALGLLAREPRIRPSRGLLIDPGDDAFRRWRLRVTAAAALLASPAGRDVRHELGEELAESPELERDSLEQLAHQGPHSPQ